jgi:hypothetical protein
VITPNDDQGAAKMQSQRDKDRERDMAEAQRMDEMAAAAEAKGTKSSRREAEFYRMKAQQSRDRAALEVGFHGKTRTVKGARY